MAREVATIPTPAEAESFVLAASGKLAGGVCSDHKLRVWSLPDAKLQLTMSLSETHNDLTAMSPDGRWIVTGDHHGDGMVWNASAGREYCELRLKPYPSTAAFSHDSRYLAVAPMGEPVQMYELTQRRLASAGLPAYEISNHARVGAACRHNLIYWRYQDYVGVGPGAHGRFVVRTADGEAKRATRRISGP